jgi:hypothetical protein
MKQIKTQVLNLKKPKTHVPIVYLTLNLNIKTYMDIFYYLIINLKIN